MSETKFIGQPPDAEARNIIEIERETVKRLAIDLGECRKRLEAAQGRLCSQVTIADTTMERLAAVLDIARSLPSITQSDLQRLEEAAKK